LDQAGFNRIDVHVHRDSTALVAGSIVQADARLPIVGFIEILIGAIKVHRSRTPTRPEQTAIFTVLLPASRFVSVVAQYFEVQVYDQFAIRGNAAIFKCQVPSFVADHVDVVGWIDSNGGSYVADEQSYGS